MDENDYINVYSHEMNKIGVERICGRIYKKHIQENGDVKMYVFTKDKKLYYTSCENEYLNELKKHQDSSST